MGAAQIVALLGAFGIGGALGAGATLFLAGQRVERSWAELREAWHGYRDQSTTSGFAALERSFDAFDGELRRLMEGLARFKKAIAR